MTKVTLNMLDDMVKEFINRQFNWVDVGKYLAAQEMTISKKLEIVLYNKMVKALAEKA